MPDINLRVNGVTRKVPSDPDRPLLGVLRDQLDLTGTKYGCGEGQCGACTVLIDGQPRRSCVTDLSDVKDKSITTIEGIAKDGKLHPVQQAFLDHGAFQCGYCTPGMILSAVALLAGSPRPQEGEIFRAMEGNVCRCGAYSRIVAAIQSAAKGGAA
jgi:isoquinoline 1-oxidoreductase alpha subunit